MTDTLIREVISLISKMDERTVEDSDSYSQMYTFFVGKHKYYNENGETALADATEVLVWITHMALDPESINAPIIPALLLRDSRSISPEDLRQEQRAFLDMLYPQISTGLLKSRIAEITLMLDTPRRWDLVDEILEGYLTKPLDEKTWYTRQQHLWTRAVKLSRQFKKETYFRRIEEQIQEYINTHSPGDSGISIALYNFIHEQQLLDSNANRNAASLIAFGTDEKLVKNFSLAERIFSLAADFYKSKRNHEKQLSALFESAECIFLEAENCAQVREQGNLLASNLYEKALQRYRLIPAARRRINGADVRIEECLKRIREHGELSLQDMQTHQLPSTDLTELAEYSINHVRDKGHIFKASMYFVGFGLMKAENMQDEEQAQFRFTDLFRTIFLSGDGRAIGRTGTAGHDHARVRQMQCFDFYLRLAVAGEIMPAMRQLLKEYNFVMGFFQELCHTSPLVPDDRVQLTAKGLYLGFEYRFYESIHIISPQVEFMVRNLLKQAGVRTSTIDEAGIENEVGLGSLLDKPEAKSLLGNELHFNLVSLFTDPLGANIRNYVAHGLLNDNSSQSDAVVYAWWLYFKIIVMSVTSAPLFRITHH